MGNISTSSKKLHIEALEDKRPLAGDVIVELSGEQGVLHHTQEINYSPGIEHQDVNGDKIASTPLDALHTVNALNWNQSTDHLNTDLAFEKLDVDGNGFIAPTDALSIVNALNTQGVEYVSNGAYEQKIKIDDLSTPESLTGAIDVDNYFELNGLGEGVSSSNGSYYLHGESYISSEEPVVDTGAEFTYVFSGSDVGNYAFQVPYLSNSPIFGKEANIAAATQWNIDFIDLGTHQSLWGSTASLDVYQDAQSDYGTVVSLDQFSGNLEIKPGEILAFTSNEPTRFVLEAQSEDGSLIRSFQYGMPGDRYLHTKFNAPVEATNYSLLRYNFDGSREELGTLTFTGVDQVIPIYDLTTPDELTANRIHTSHRFEVERTNLEIESEFAYLEGTSGEARVTIPFRPESEEGFQFSLPFVVDNYNWQAVFRDNTTTTWDTGLYDIVTQEDLWGGKTELVVNHDKINPDSVIPVELDSVGETPISVESGDFLALITGEEAQEIRILHEDNDGFTISAIDYRIPEEKVMYVEMLSQPTGTARTQIYQYEAGTGTAYSLVELRYQDLTETVTVPSLRDPSLLPSELTVGDTLRVEEVEVTSDDLAFLNFSGVQLDGGGQFSYVINPNLSERMNGGVDLSVPYFGPLPGGEEIETLPNVFDLALSELYNNDGPQTVWDGQPLTVYNNPSLQDDLQVIDLDAVSGNEIIEIDSNQLVAIGSGISGASFSVSFLADDGSLEEARQFITQEDIYAQFRLSELAGTEVRLERYDENGVPLTVTYLAIR